MKRKITFVLAIMMLLTILTSCGKDNNTNTEQHVHAYGDWNIVTEATCTEKGLEERVCSCGEKETREINVTEHDYTKLDTGNTHIKTNATCLKQAEYYYSCSKCGANGSETFSFGSIASHKWDNGTESSGIIEYHCQNCTETKNVFNKKTEVQATVSKTDLQSVGGIELKNATIIFDDDTLNGLDDNVEISADIVSGEELNEVKSNLTPAQQAVIGSAQIFDFSIGDEPTTFDGKVTVTIPYVLGENENPDDVVVWYLNGSDVEVISATYASGFVSFETNHFSLYVPVVMSAEDRCAQGLHDFTETKVDSTCTKQGSIKKVCIHCEEQELQVLELLPHTYNQTIVSEIYLKSPATDTQNAIYYKSCICGATGTETFEYKAMSEGLDFKLSDDRTYYFLTGIGTCTDTDIVIPFIYNNVPVTRIYPEAFHNCSGLTSIEIPDSVTSIGYRAFSGCSGLTSIGIPDSVTSIDYGTFEDCSGLTSIEIPDSVTSIGDGAFEGCSGLTSITIPFVGATKDGTINTHLGYIFGTYSYSSNSSYVPSSLKSVTITGGTSIGEDAFWKCNGLTSIVIPDSVTSIGSSAFYECSGLNEVHISDIAKWCGISFGDDDANPLYYAHNLYLNDTLITDLVIPDSVTSIGSYVFEGCSGLTSIEIPDSVTSIGGFEGCSGLTSIVIPDSVTSIGYGAFCGCSGLTSITIPFVGATKDGTSYTHFGYIFGASRISSNSSYVPSSLKSVTITGGTSIDSYAFSGCSGLTSIIIPDSVTSIGSDAFEDCCGLTSIVIPDIVTSIGKYAFYNCSGLTSIVIPDSVTSIGYKAFYNCSGLTSITIPFVGATKDGTSDTHFGYIFDKIDYSYDNSRYIIPSSLKLVTITGGTSIGDDAFSGCSGLTSIEIPDSVRSIGERAFISCSGLTSIVIPDSVTSIGYKTFYNCSGLTSIVIPDGVTSIGGSAFEGCSGLTSIVIPDSVTSIGSRAFCSCSGLTSVTIGNGVTSIDSFAFCSCKGLTSIVIPDSVTSIGSYAFEECSGLTSVTIGNGVTSIGGATFYDCYKLVEVYNKSSLPITKESSDYGYVGCYAKNIYTPSSGSSKLSTDENGYIIYTDGTDKILIGYTGQEKDLTLPTGITKLYQYAFYYCSGLTSIVIPDSVTSIGSYAFYECSGLTSVTIGNSVTSIGGSAFEGCSGLTSIVIPDSVMSIGGWAFDECSGLTSVTIGNSVTSIGDEAFRGCSGLTFIVIPDSVTSIGEGAFRGCSGLTSIVVSNGNTKYHSNGNCLIETASKTLIAGCNTSIIPTDGSVTSIGSYAFYECSGLTSVTIGNSVTSIGYRAFSGCSGLTSIGIPDSVTSIDYGTFEDCSGLTSVTIGNSVTSIGVYAFSYCYRLVEVYNKSTLPITKGSSDYGRVGYYAKEVYTSDYVSKLSTDKDGYITYTDGTEISLIGYAGQEKDLTLPADITEINQYAFYYCSGLTSIVISDSVTSIGAGAFEGCSGLTSIILPFIGATKDGTSNTHFGYIFGSSSSSYNSKYVPSSLKSVTITGGTSIGEDAFSGCSGLTSIVIPDSVTSIGEDAFSGCRGLTSIEIPDSVTSIGEDAFSGCSGLTSITIPFVGATKDGTGNTYFGYIFGRFTTDSVPSSLKSVTITGGTSIGEGAFCRCSGLTSIVIPDSVTSIGSSAFEECSGLTSIVIPDSVTSIGGSAFEGCSGLTSIVIPDSVTSIGSSAFEGCSGLTSIVIPDSVTCIGKYAFYRCNGLKKVYYNGTASEWTEISIDSGNSDLTYATRYYYSASQPTEEGNWWHYDTDGVTVLEW